MRLRSAMYRRGLLASARVPAMVISVGNLTMGGAGKTPMVLGLARRLLAMGRHPAIVSRGYGGRITQPVEVVSDGRQVLLAADHAGDEPCMLARALPGVPVLVGPKRAEVARAAILRFGVDTIVMDDGFQHLALGRDLDLVLFSGRSPLGNGRVFPGGDLREPWSALARAHGFVITGVDTGNHGAVEELVFRLNAEFPGRPVFLASYQPVAVVRAGEEGAPLPPQSLLGVPLYGFAGIAQPESFRRTLLAEGVSLAGFRGFADHHSYRSRDVEAVEAAARASGAQALVATEKDLVKLRGHRFTLPLWGLRIELCLEGVFDRFLASRLAVHGKD
ncbi:MAG: tetraacyldisaccharide 4'-kinase [Thermodesulfobacteriota bacterium]